MKRTIFIFSACLIGFASCKKIAEPKVYSFLTDVNAFESKADAIAAVNGVYARLKQPSGVSDSYQYYAGFQMAITDFTTDIGHSFQSGDISLLSEAQWSPTNKYTNFAYQHQYKMISDANIALFYLPKIKTLSTEEQNQYYSEIRFLRALGYMDLTDAFGPVILVTEKDVEKADYVTKLAPSSVEDINKFIIADLEFAAANLPVNYKSKTIYPTNDVGRATKGAALSLLVKLYMREHKWQDALTTIQRIEALNQYGLFPSYKGLFAESNKWCEESIFSALADALNDGTELMNHFGPLNNTEVSDRWQYYAVSWSFWNSYARNDERREMFYYDYIGSDKLHYMQAPVGQTKPPTGFYYLPDVASKKYADPSGSTTYYDGHGIPILRYADIVMCHAEALNELNGPTQASIDLINKVKGRAKATLLGPPSGYTKETLRNAILQERGWEFFFECKRRQDLIRTGMYQQVVNTYLTGIGKPASVNITRDKYFSYPQTQTDLNPNLSNAGRQ